MIRKTYRFLFLFSLAVLLVFWLFSFAKGLPSIYPPYFDDEGILATLAFFSEWSNPEMASKYPVLTYLLYAPIIILVFGFSALFTGSMSISPQYPFGFSNPELVFSITIYLMRLLNLVLLGLSVRYAYVSLKRYKIPVKYPEFLVVGIFIPIVLYYGYTTNRDFLVYLFSTLIAFELWLIFGGKKSVFWLMIFAIAGVLTKDFMAFFGISAVLLGSLAALKKTTFLSIFKEILKATGILMALLLIYNPKRLWVHIQHWLLNGDGVEPYRQFPSETIFEKLKFLEEISPIFLKMWPILIPIFVLILLLRNPNWKILLIFLFLIPSIHIFGIIVPIGFSYPRFYLPVYASWLVALLHLLSQAHSVKSLIPIAILRLHTIIVILCGITYMAWDYYNFPKKKLTEFLESTQSNYQRVVFKGGVQNLPISSVYNDPFFFLEKNSALKIKHHIIPMVEIDSLSNPSPYLLIQDQLSPKESVQLIHSIEFQELDFVFSRISFMAHHSYYNYYFYEVK